MEIPLLDVYYIMIVLKIIIIVIDFSRQKELDADPKAIPLIDFVGRLKNSR